METQSSDVYRDRAEETGHPMEGGDSKDRKCRLYTKSKLPASDYVINPYVGCVHGCLYCYACFMGRFAQVKAPWGTYAKPKTYSSMELPRQQEGKTILVGSVTDAYNPAERRYQKMSGILESLREYRGHVEILTKSKLILRDLELIRQIPDLSVGVSLAFTSEEDVRILEPRACGVRERLYTLKVLHENGIRTYLFAAPYFPEITDLSRLVEWTEGTVDSVCVENLNLRGSYKSKILAFIKERYPQLSPLYEEVYEKGGGAAYWKGVETQLEEMRHKMSVPLISYLYHEKIKKS